MPKLRRHRRDHRARAPKARKRRNLVKFIPEADSDFAYTAKCVFVTYLQHDPAAYGVSAEDVACIDAAVMEFRSALAAASWRHRRSPKLVLAKDVARAKAEEIVRRYANIIRANPDVSDSNKKLLRIKVRPEKLGKRKCPQSPPRLMFLGSGDGVTGGMTPGSGSGVHVLRFLDYNESVPVHASSELGMVRQAKPDGAVRVELYFDMVPPGDPRGIPKLPNERGWPKYLRSFTRSPMEVEFPIPSEPMLIVYWARWADSTGEVSRWSRTCVARVEGWTAVPQAPGKALPEGDAARRVETKYIIVQTPYALPDGLDGDDELEAAGARLLPGMQLEQPERQLLAGPGTSGTLAA